MKAITGIAIVVLAATGAAATGKVSPAATRQAIAAALADPARADQAGDDARRSAAAVLGFSGVKRGDTVIDYFPGSGYWTRIFTGIVGPAGHVWALWPAGTEKYAEKPLPALKARGLANVTAELAPGPGVEQPVDLFWTVQNYHDVANDGRGEAGIARFNAAVLAGLKPGGTYLIVDHADAPGTGISGTQTRHRIDPAAVKAQVIKAGFKFVGESRVLRNAKDDHSRNVFDPEIRGHTDQFVFRFRKPR